MTNAEAQPAQPPAARAVAAVVAPARLTAPERHVVLIAIALLALASVVMIGIPDRSEAEIPSGRWAFITVVLLFGLFEYVVFNVQFRREGISFSMSEVPLAFGLAFLSPWALLVARIVATVPVLVFARRNKPYKLFFNLSLFAAETAVAVLVVRLLAGRHPDVDAVLLLAVTAALLVIAPLTSMLISFMISLFEGGAHERIVGELRATWWLYTVNAVLASMAVALALIEPWLALMAVLPSAGIWYILHSFGEIGQELRDLRDVHGFAGRIGRTLDVYEIGETAVAEVIRLTRGVGAALVRFTDEGPVIHIGGDVGVQLPTSPSDTAWRAHLIDGAVRVVERSDLRSSGVEVDTSVRAVLIAPMTDENAISAVLIVVDRNIQARFDEQDVARVRSITEQLAVSLRRGVLHEQLEYEARHDSLTGLPARSLFERCVSDQVAQQPSAPPSWVLMLDLDRFKEVNDTLGHHAGDELLVRFAERMRCMLGPGDVLGRLAGDEFAILCVGRTEAEISAFAHACAAEGGRPVMLDDLEIVVTVSVGAAQIAGADDDAVQSMRRADIAMYNAKWQRTGVEFYREEIDRRTPARLSMLGDLRTAIETDQLKVVYQPKLDLATGLIIGAEALVRWEHPVRGVVPPSEFVRVAEDTGLIKQLTDLVLAQGIGVLAEFQAAGLPIGLSVNLSTHDLFDARLPERVHAYLNTHHVDPSMLTLEITESSLLVDAPRTRATIDELHEVGIRMAVDDFGTGYSSLSYLRQLPVHELKIDQSFVAGMLTDEQDEVIVRSTVDLGHNLNLLVVAEGVESLDTLDRLEAMGCDVAQGYVISEPLAADRIVGWLLSSRSMRWRRPAS